MRSAFTQDARYAFRIARQNPGSTLAAFLALTLGIGATTAIFSAVDSVILRPLPVKDASSVVRIFESDSRRDKDFVSMADFLDWKRQLQSFSALALFRNTQANLTGETAPLRVRLLLCDSELLPLLGVAPIRGRNFAAEENQPGHDEAAILSWSFWQGHFGGEDVLGRKIILDERPYTVIGVLPPKLRLFGDNEIWLPLTFDLHSAINSRGYHWYMPVGRLRPGVSLAQANSELAAAAAALAAEYPKQNRGVGAKAITLRDSIAGDVRPALLMLFGAGLCVLLIACGNVANLALTRAAARHREISVRIALGASRTRLFQQLLTENTLLSLAAAIAGVGVAVGCIRVVKHLPGIRLPHPEDLAVDWRVMVFAIALGALAGIGFGLAPAIRASVVRVHEALKQASGRLTESKSQQYLRQVFVSLETAIATFLLIHSALLIRSYAKVSRIDIGFNPSRVLALQVSLPTARYGPKHPAAINSFVDRVLPGIRSIPGVESAAVTNNLPLVAIGGGGSVLTQGRPIPDNPADIPYVQWTAISPGYFQTMKIPLIRGRHFTDRDREGSKDVIIVNQTFARQFFDGENPIGKNISAVMEPPQWNEVVGEFADVPQLGLEKKPIAEIFVPVAQNQPTWLTIVIRASGDPLAYVNSVQEQVQKADPAVAVFLPRTMERILENQLGWRVFQSSLVGVFAAIAILLSCIGIYAVVAYSVSQRIAEIGIRMALGAQKRDILLVIVRQGAMPAFWGALIGALWALSTSKLLAQLLYGIEPTDAPTYVSVIALFFAVALLASYLPARRAAALDPSRALRYE